MTTNNPTPRDLDPKAKNTVPDDETVPMIVHREKYFEGSVQHVREHRVPLAEWAAYEKEHGF